MRHIIFLLFANAFCDAYAQDVQPIRLNDVLVTAEGTVYPKELSENGVQGKVSLVAQLDTKGRLGNVHIQSSSRSKELDNAALDAASKLQYGERPDGQPVEILVSIRFNRDSVRSLPNKTCAEFNTDVSYFKKTFPENDVIDMPSFDITVGVLTAVTKTEELLDFVKRLKTIKKEIIDGCANSPDKKYLELAVSAARRKAP